VRTEWSVYPRARWNLYLRTAGLPLCLVDAVVHEQEDLSQPLGVRREEELPLDLEAAVPIGAFVVVKSQLIVCLPRGKMNSRSRFGSNIGFLTQARPKHLLTQLECSSIPKTPPFLRYFGSLRRLDQSPFKNWRLRQLSTFVVGQHWG
jgi:hypothetical protein